MFQNNVPEVQKGYVIQLKYFERSFGVILNCGWRTDISWYFIFIKIFVIIIWLIQIDLTWPQNHYRSRL